MRDTFFAGTKTRLSFSPSAPRLFPRAQESLAWGPVTHRSPAFEALCGQTLSRLGQLLGSTHLLPAVTAGSGTLANDLMLSFMTTECRCPLVLSNGEFGRRLHLQCKRHFVKCHLLDVGWGGALTRDNVRAAIEKHAPDGLLFTAVETSTGMVNPLEELAALAEELHLVVGIDSVSALGNVHHEYSRQSISCVSSTSGKALAALAGVAIVFMRDKRHTGSMNESQPVSLDAIDLLQGQQSPGKVRNTLSSTLLATLHESLEHMFSNGLESHFTHNQLLKKAVLRHAQEAGFEIFSGGDSPCVTTLKIPSGCDWQGMMSQLEDAGFEIYHNTPYLADENVFQVATFGDFTVDDVKALFSALACG